jgi:tetratricopeptide (TPR) repeat protein
MASKRAEYRIESNLSFDGYSVRKLRLAIKFFLLATLGVVGASGQDAPVDTPMSQRLKAALSRVAEKNSTLTLQLLPVRCHVEAGEFALAEGRLQRLLSKEPGSADGLHLLGCDYQCRAQATLQQMIEIDADFYGVHELLGREHEEKTEYDLAIHEYQAALAKGSDVVGEQRRAFWQHIESRVDL